MKGWSHWLGTLAHCAIHWRGLADWKNVLKTKEWNETNFISFHLRPSWDSNIMRRENRRQLESEFRSPFQHFVTYTRLYFFFDSSRSNSKLKAFLTWISYPGYSIITLYLYVCKYVYFVYGMCSKASDQFIIVSLIERNQLDRNWLSLSIRDMIYQIFTPATTCKS